jgi:hypothetical protein
MRKTFPVVCIYCFLTVVLFFSTRLDSIPDMVNYQVSVCAHSETKALERASQRCIEDAGRRCRCTCTKTDKPCEDKNYLWNCECTRLIHDNW